MRMIRQEMADLYQKNVIILAYFIDMSANIFF